MKPMNNSRLGYDIQKANLNKFYFAMGVVREQSEDEALWCLADSIEMSYLQQELRRLHRAIEEGGENK